MKIDKIQSEPPLEDDFDTTEGTKIIINKTAEPQESDVNQYLYQERNIRFYNAVNNAALRYIYQETADGSKKAYNAAMGFPDTCINAEENQFIDPRKCSPTSPKYKNSHKGMRVTNCLDCPFFRCLILNKEEKSISCSLNKEQEFIISNKDFNEMKMLDLENNCDLNKFLFIEIQKH